MTTDFRILIVGGYGIFGGRLVELLEDDPRLTLIVAGRSLSSAREYCASRRRALARLIPASFDRASDDSHQLIEYRPQVVVDASGPFQEYGSQPYRLVEGCIACGINYLDLADGSDFVAGIANFDASAKAAGVYVLSGVSSFPVLTAAAVRELSHGLSRVDSIRGGIAPSPYAIIGRNVIRAIANYAGQTITLKRQGRVERGYPFAESMQFTIATPGRVPLERRRFSLVDVPDLRVLEAHWPNVREIWMGAAPVPAMLHRALSIFAWLVRLRLLKSLGWMADSMHSVVSKVRWGEHRGGMFVRVRGIGDNGREIIREWHLLAEGDDGPLIPCMAVEAIVRKSMQGISPTPGARAAISDVDLADYEKLFERRTIYCGIHERDENRSKPLYERMLGSAWLRLAPEIRQLHTVVDDSVFSGPCTVHRGRTLLSRSIARLIGFPKAGGALRMRVKLSVQRDGERWTRSCGGRTFSSVQSSGRGRHERLIRERFGPMAVNIALVVVEGRLHYVIRSWSFLGIPLPLKWGPRSTAVESVEDGKFRFDVEISHPLAGLIVRYGGLLSRE